MKKVPVTGADGFIGSHLTETLVRPGHDVRAYNTFNSWGRLDHCGDDVKGRFDVFAGDIRDPHGARAAMSGCDQIFYLATAGIQTVINYPLALPFLPAYSRFGYSPRDLANAHSNQSRVLSLPIFPEMTEAQMRAVADAVRSFPGA